MKILRLFRIIYRIVWDYPKHWELTIEPENMRGWYWAGLSAKEDRIGYERRRRK